MNDGRIQDIVIVGGGSGGWMTAAFLAKKLSDVRITLVESPGIPTVGVGEATIATFAFYLNELGLKSQDWMPACDASFKYQIRFKNWHRKGDDFWHPFESLVSFENRLHLGQFWYLKYLNSPPHNRNRESLYSDCFMSVDLSRKNLIQRGANSAEFSDNYRIMMNDVPVRISVPHAWHFDAGLFGEYLRTNVAAKLGVKHVVGKVVHIDRDESGNIASVSTEEGKQIAGDLFIDCSGFHAALIDKELGEPFVSYDDSLFCDKAVAMSVPYDDPREELEPITTADARSSGWVWNIPLRSRRGTGYVYSSQFQSSDAAETEFRQFLGADRVADCEARHISMRVGRHRNAWVKNCVAIGLAAGFVEPLESTGLHLVYANVCQLADLLEPRVFNAGIVASYNSFSNRVMDEARDFVSVHYALTAREDTDFWRHAKYNTSLSDSLAASLVEWKDQFPNYVNGRLFDANSWVCILNGMNYLPGSQSYTQMDSSRLQPQFEMMNAIQKLKQSIAASAVNHHDYLEREFPL